ncbi:MAG TPA: hypothetical protein VJZ02_04260, partial [Candidatus Brocadiales bacterium]|nr:hypothetical protein [Candidatus Brocadiales bacterium]
PEPVNILYGAKTGRPLEMLTGFYDIKIPSSPAIWIKNVTIEEAKTTEIEAGGYGKVLIAGNDATGKPIKDYFFMYAPEDKKKSLANGTTNEPLDIVEGNYYVRVALKPEITYEDVRIRRNETTKIDLPLWGQLNIVAMDFEGKPLRVHYWVYKKEPWKDNIVASGDTNKPAGLPPGEYNVYVGSYPDIKYKDVVIKLGEVTELKLPEYGALLVRAVDARGKPLDEIFRLYEPKGKDVISSGQTKRRLDVFPGIYDLKMTSYRDITYDAVKVEAGKITEIEVIVKEGK